MSNVQYFKQKEIAEKTWQIEYAFTDREHVYCYLIEGRDYALVIDTMYGYGNLRAFCETLTDKPLKLVNTHFHFDHCAGNFDFDECYLHYLDITNYYDSRVRTPEEMLKAAKEEAFPEVKDQMELSDMCSFRQIPVYPLEDGDVFDLGDRNIAVVLVTGHSAGSIALIDPKTRIAFTGDCCNGNTLLGFGNSAPVERFHNALMNFRRWKDQFDILYGGHQVMPIETIDEGIELSAKVIVGSDDKEERSFLNRTMVYAARHNPDGFGRADGKNFNMSYSPKRIFETGRKPQVITLEKEPMF